MASWVKGATFAVPAIQRARYALKDSWSTLQLARGSQAISNMMSVAS
jgi:hypothetical protein